MDILESRAALEKPALERRILARGRPVRVDASVPEDAWRLGEVETLRRIGQDDGPAVELQPHAQRVSGKSPACRFRGAKPFDTYDQDQRQCPKMDTSVRRCLGSGIARRQGRVRLSTRCRPLDDDVLWDAERRAGKGASQPNLRGLWRGGDQRLRVQRRTAVGRSPSTAPTYKETWMCPRRPYITTLADVTIRASRAKTEGRQHVVVEIPRGRPPLDATRLLSPPAGQWGPRGALLRCLIDQSPQGKPIIHIDDNGPHYRSSAGSCAPTRAGAFESCSSKKPTPILR